jgi:hypothetical protein
MRSPRARTRSQKPFAPSEHSARREASTRVLVHHDARGDRERE